LAGRARVGTSGWVYPHWRGKFYPKGLAQEEWFGFFAERFHTVEINNTFYNLPSETTFRQWRDQAPAGFLYAVKASRYLTHMKKLKKADGALDRFLDRARELGPRLGPVLFHLPPRWKKNPDRLASFVERLPDGPLYAFEFRDPSWYDEDIVRILRERDCAFCVHDMKGCEAPKWTAGAFAYLRFHGPRGGYGGKYGGNRLRPWVRWIRERLSEGRDVYAYFNNDAQGNAIEDARTLLDKLSTEED